MAFPSYMEILQIYLYIHTPIHESELSYTYILKRIIMNICFIGFWFGVARDI